MRELLLPMLPKLWPISPRFFGEWFGGPLENPLRVMDITADGDRLTLTFDESERLEIDEPRGLGLHMERKKRDEPLVAIATARCVTWHWYSYGKPKVDQNLYYIRYERSDHGLAVSSNVTWFHPGQAATVDAPAVALH